MDKEFEILKSFHDQFSDIQNTRKNIFIQFLTAVFVVILGYAIILSQINGDYIQFANVAIEEKTSKVLSYSLIHFVLAYIVTQIVLVLLASLILNTGYEFRRDQLVVYETRKKYVKDSYSDIFGEIRFSPENKTWWTYLPGFHFIFYSVFFFIQITLIASFLVVVTQVKTMNLATFGNVLWIGIVAIAPFVYSNAYYVYYFRKYKKAMTKGKVGVVTSSEDHG